MANIEIHGLPPAEAQEMEKRLAHMTNWEDLVITTVPDRVVDRHGKPRPFLRIWDDSSASNVVSVVHHHIPEMDIEVAPQLARFIEGN